MARIKQTLIYLFAAFLLLLFATSCNKNKTTNETNIPLATFVHSRFSGRTSPEFKIYNLEDLEKILELIRSEQMIEISPKQAKEIKNKNPKPLGDMGLGGFYLKFNAPFSSKELSKISLIVIEPGSLGFVKFLSLETILNTGKKQVTKEKIYHSQQNSIHSKMTKLFYRLNSKSKPEHIS